MYIELQVGTTYFLGAVLSRILIPSLGSSFPTIQSYTVKKLYSEKVTQLHSHHTAKEKTQYVQTVDVVRANYSRMYASNAVGRRRVRVGRPEPEAD